MTPHQIKMARSALGLIEGKRSYRNRYFVPVDSPQEDEWNDLCNRGLAMREKGGGRLAHFYLTEAGARSVLGPGESLDPEDFPSPQENPDA
jgi:hypothetical protein